MGEGWKVRTEPLHPVAPTGDRAGSGNPFAQLGAIAGVAYLAAVLWLRWRS